MLTNKKAFPGAKKQRILPTVLVGSAECIRWCRFNFIKKPCENVSSLLLS